MARILVPIASPGFDPTEVGVPFTLWADAGHEVVLATADGRPAEPDRLLNEGAFFGIIRVLEDARRRFDRMRAHPAFQAPVAWGQIEDISAYDALFVPGGHMLGMRALATDPVLQEHVRRFWALERPFAAMCHGVALLAAAGVLYRRRTTCFLAGQERLFRLVTRPGWGRYAEVFPRLVADEVRAGGAELVPAPLHVFAHGTLEDDSAAFVHEEGPYLSARWPGDAYLLGKRLLARLP